MGYDSLGHQLTGPQTPKDTKPPAMEQMPCPLPNANPSGLASQSIATWGQPTRPQPVFAQPTPLQVPPKSLLPLHL
ncbi:hypothetical protein RhiTH_011087 [Rhizoctonia solani]